MFSAINCCNWWRPINSFFIMLWQDGIFRGFAMSFNAVRFSFSSQLICVCQAKSNSNNFVSVMCQSSSPSFFSPNVNFILINLRSSPSKVFRQCFLFKQFSWLFTHRNFIVAASWEPLDAPDEHNGNCTKFHRQRKFLLEQWVTLKKILARLHPPRLARRKLFFSCFLLSWEMKSYRSTRI